MGYNGLLAIKMPTYRYFCSLVEVSDQSPLLGVSDEPPGLPLSDESPHLSLSRATSSSRASVNALWSARTIASVSHTRARRYVPVRPMKKNATINPAAKRLGVQLLIGDACQTSAKHAGYPPEILINILGVDQRDADDDLRQPVGDLVEACIDMDVAVLRFVLTRDSKK
jgi:hypothetical protein